MRQDEALTLPSRDIFNLLSYRSNSSNLPDSGRLFNRPISSCENPRQGLFFKAIVGYYGGTSLGDVTVDVLNTTLVCYYDQQETTKCFTVQSCSCAGAYIRVMEC